MTDAKTDLTTDPTADPTTTALAEDLALSLGTDYFLMREKSIYLLGSPEQRERWLPAMARLETIGAFALTEPDHGSDAVALETTARRGGESWVISGRERWPGNAVWCDLIVVFARDVEDRRSRRSS
jgi:alkylation response protein AidB-like acyl-CoA dehydrogenase